MQAAGFAHRTVLHDHRHDCADELINFVVGMHCLSVVQKFMRMNYRIDFKMMKLMTQ